MISTLKNSIIITLTIILTSCVNVLRIYYLPSNFTVEPTFDVQLILYKNNTYQTKESSYIGPTLRKKLVVRKSKKLNYKIINNNIILYDYPGYLGDSLELIYSDTVLISAKHSYFFSSLKSYRNNKQ